MENLITNLRNEQYTQKAARRLEECRMFFERFSAGEPPPKGVTYEEWAKELLN